MIVENAYLKTNPQYLDNATGMTITGIGTSDHFNQ